MFVVSQKPKKKSKFIIRTEASRIINDIMDKHDEVLGDIDELDIYSKEKGNIEDEQ